MRASPHHLPSRPVVLAPALLLCVGLLAGCATRPDGKLPEAVWQCPDGSVELSANEPVFDARRARAGEGVAVRGLNGWEGEISGVPAPASRFHALLIGMRPSEVAALIGAPRDDGSFMTTQRGVSLRLFGSDESRYEMVYPGSGRLVFSTRLGFGPGRYLTWIIHESRPEPATAQRETTGVLRR